LSGGADGDGNADPDPDPEMVIKATAAD